MFTVREHGALWSYVTAHRYAVSVFHLQVAALSLKPEASLTCSHLSDCLVRTGGRPRLLLVEGSTCVRIATCRGRRAVVWVPDQTYSKDLIKT